MLELAALLGIPSRECRIDRSQLLGAEEVFLCGTGVQIAPVTSVDGRRIGEGKVGPVTSRLQESYLRVARGLDPEHQDWVEAVYR